MKRRFKVTAVFAAPLPVLALAAGPVAAGSAAGGPAAGSRVVLSSEFVGATVGATRLGVLGSGARLSLEVSLAPRDEAGLDAFIAAVSEPSSGVYRHYLTVAQFAADYGATAATIASVSSYLKSDGLSVVGVSGNDLTLSVSGTAAEAEAAFGVSIGTYRDPAGGDFYANVAAPSVPGDLAGAIDGVAGLSDAQELTHGPAIEKSGGGAMATVSSDFTPTMARDGYNLAGPIKSGYKGTGETVGLVEFSAYTAADVAKYNTTYSLGAPTPTVVKVDGGTTDTSAETEDELDIEITNALAPGAKVDVYEAPNTDAGEVALYSALVSDDVPVVATSWGEPETSEHDMAADDADFKEAAAQGQSVYASSGGGGVGGTGLEYPASDPYVTGVGGTDLTLTSSFAWSSETADSGSGGGVSVEWATPGYQKPVNSGSFRDVPDAAANAGSSWRIYTEGAWEEVAGVSMTAPQWAAFTADYDTAAADLGKAKFGYADPFIYTVAESSEYHSAFHDITSGGNGTEKAGPGYDLVTGWGSFNGGNFIADEL